MHYLQFTVLLLKEKKLIKANNVFNTFENNCTLNIFKHATVKNTEILIGIFLPYEACTHVYRKSI